MEYSHPSNWQIWSSTEKDRYDLKEVADPVYPDERLYFSVTDNQGNITSTAKAIDDSGSGDNLVLGLKSTFKNEVKKQQGSLLSQTDWYIVRKVDKSTAIPSNIQTWRDAIRTKATEMENALDACSSVDDIAKLWLEVDIDGKKSGILYDWPELG
jgi:hypothetical protein